MVSRHIRLDGAQVQEIATAKAFGDFDHRTLARARERAEQGGKVMAGLHRCDIRKRM